MTRPPFDPRVASAGPDWSHRATALVLGLPLAILAAHAAVFSRWLVDDAGITFAYARHLASAQGLVSQTGVAPVEGYSNPLWTLTIAAFWAVGLFSIDWTPKILAFLLDATVFYMVARDLASRTRSRWAVALPIGLLAACSPFVIWTSSGLENALLACLIAWLALHSLASAQSAAPHAGLDRRAGLVAGLIALTRPDGLAYVIVYLLLAAVEEWRRGPGAFRRTVLRARYLGTGFLPVFAAYLVFRLAYFGDWVPNTARAKQGPSLSSLVAPGKLGALLEGAGGDAGWLLLAGAVVVVSMLARLGRLEMRTLVLLSYTSAAAGIYLLLPNDWMGEFRFATPFFALAYWTSAELAIAGRASLGVSPRLHTLGAACVALVVVQVLAVFIVRTGTFASCPAVPLDTVRVTARGFNQLSARLGGGPHSLLTPDLGGQLLDSRLRIYDLAGLCDRTIAGTLSNAGGSPRLHDYVLDEVRPTFIHVSGAFVRLSSLHGDARFVRDYVPLYESWNGRTDAATPGPGQRPTPWWGDYVRRDALVNDATMLTVLRRLHQDLGMTAWNVWEAAASPGTWRAMLTLSHWAQGDPFASGCAHEGRRSAPSRVAQP